MRVVRAGKVRAVFAQMDLCGAKSACRSSAREERQNGRSRALVGGRNVRIASSRRSLVAIARIAKCLFFSALRIDGARHRCIRRERARFDRLQSMPPASDSRDARPKKKSAGLLTGQKTVIRFRPADETCGIE
jgi:hypothetical protein